MSIDFKATPWKLDDSNTIIQEKQLIDYAEHVFMHLFFMIQACNEMNQIKCFVDVLL